MTWASSVGDENNAFSPWKLSISSKSIFATLISINQGKYHQILQLLSPICDASNWHERHRLATRWVIIWCGDIINGIWNSARHRIHKSDKFWICVANFLGQLCCTQWFSFFYLDWLGFWYLPGKHGTIRPLLKESSPRWRDWHSDHYPRSWI